MEILVLLVVIVALPLGQALLARERWDRVPVHGAERGPGAYRSAQVVKTRRLWSGVHPGVLVASSLGLFWAGATICFAGAGLFLPPAWPVAVSGFFLAPVLLVVSTRLACRHPSAARFVRGATTYSFLHHGAVLLTFAAFGLFGAEPSLFLVALVACAIGVAITALLRAALRFEIEPPSAVEPLVEATA